jgi:hypothetical protein
VAAHRMRSLRSLGRKGGRHYVSGKGIRVPEEDTQIFQSSERGEKDTWGRVRQWRKKQIERGIHSGRKPFNKAKYLHELYLLKKKHPEIDVYGPMRAGQRSVRSRQSWKRRKAEVQP